MRQSLSATVALKRPALRSGGQGFLVLVIVILYTRLLAGSFPPGVLSQLTGLLTMLLLLVLMVFCLFHFRIQRRYLSMLSSLLAIICVAVLSYVVTSPPETEAAAEFFMRIIFLVLWIVFSAQLLTRRAGFALFVQWCRFAVFLGAILAIFQVILFPSVFAIRGNTRAFGMMGHPVSFGMFIYLAMMFCEFGRIKLGQRRELIDWLTLAAGLLSMALAVTQTAWMMLLITLFLLFLSRFRRSTKMIVLPILAIMTLVLLYILPFTREVFSYFRALQQLGEIDTSTFSYQVVTDSVSWRVVNWKMSIANMLPQWYVGLGPGQAEHYNYFHMTSHSMPVEILVELGVFGLLFLFVFLFRVGGVLRDKATDDPADARARRLARAVSVGLLAATFLSGTFLEQTLSLQVLLAMIILADMPLRRICAEKTRPLPYSEVHDGRTN